MKKEAAPLFKASLILQEPLQAQVALVDYYAAQAARRRFQLEEFGVARADLHLISSHIDSTVQSQMQFGERDVDGHLIFAQTSFNKAFTEGQREAAIAPIEEPYAMVSQQLINLYTEYCRKYTIFEYCPTGDLPDAVIATGGIPIATDS